MVSYVEMTQGVEGVGLNAQHRDDGRERQRAQQNRRMSREGEVPAHLNGSAAMMLRNATVAQANTAAGMGRQASDVTDRTAGFGHEQMVAQENATEVGHQTVQSLSPVENDAMSVRLG